MAGWPPVPADSLWRKLSAAWPFRHGLGSGEAARLAAPGLRYRPRNTCQPRAHPRASLLICVEILACLRTAHRRGRCPRQREATPLPSGPTGLHAPERRHRMARRPRPHAGTRHVHDQGALPPALWLAPPEAHAPVPKAGAGGPPRTAQTRPLHRGAQLYAARPERHAAKQRKQRKRLRGSGQMHAEHADGPGKRRSSEACRTRPSTPAAQHHANRRRIRVRPCLSALKFLLPCGPHTAWDVAPCQREATPHAHRTAQLPDLCPITAAPAAQQPHPPVQRPEARTRPRRHTDRTSCTRTPPPGGGTNPHRTDRLPRPHAP